MARLYYLLVGAGVAVLAACGEKPAAANPEPAAAPPAEAAPPVVDVVGLDYAFQAPDTFPAGVVTLRLRNEGKDIHHIQVARLDGGKTVADLPAALAGGEPPSWLVPLGGPNAPAPGGTFDAQVELTPGSYVLLCLIPAPDGQLHVAKGMVKPFTVAGTPADTSFPASDVTLRLTDYDFVFSTPLTAGRHVIRIETDASQMHEMFIARLNEGKTPLELAQWAEKHVGPPPGIPIGGVTGIAPGLTNTIEVNLEPGNYALICFMPDAKDGKPHFVHGMIKQLTIS